MERLSYRAKINSFCAGNQFCWYLFDIVSIGACWVPYGKSLPAYIIFTHLEATVTKQQNRNLATLWVYH